MSLPRASGILLHPTSLPSEYGIGDLGDEAFRFVDFLAQCKQTYWQVLPLGPTGYGDSPYQSLSAFAGNPLLISPRKLLEAGLLSEDDLGQVPEFSSDKVDFARVSDFKTELLNCAFKRFQANKNSSLNNEYCAFVERSSWLEPYALYRAIKHSQREQPWSAWPEQLRQPEALGLAKAAEMLSDCIEAQKFFQFLFFKQWSELKAYCHHNGIRLIGDIPIFVAYDSAEVWMHRELFKLDEVGNPVVVAGVPPDYFSATGQLWGNPIFDWDYLHRTGYRWWIERFGATLNLVDLARLDHFRGFAACWEIPYGDSTAQRGQWVPAPGRELFSALAQKFGPLPIIAEDLGVITPDVEELRDAFGFPGMRILQMAFRDKSNSDLPHTYVHNSVVYTGTHDHDTALGWFNSTAGVGSTRTPAQIEHDRNYCMQYLNTDGKEINWDFIRAASASVSDTAIFPLQDIIGLDSSARMNLPGSAHGNWTWRFKWQQLDEAGKNRLRKYTQLYARCSE